VELVTSRVEVKNLWSFTYNPTVLVFGAVLRTFSLYFLLSAVHYNRDRNTAAGFTWITLYVGFLVNLSINVPSVTGHALQTLSLSVYIVARIVWRLL
jgi:hypothetical protein